ncbi:MAG TPA: ATP synthase subunit I [Bryobacteraceae bacterium]|nr:ATP synthase subunit I [Bryobacteraceae bacterium]
MSARVYVMSAVLTAAGAAIAGAFGGAASVKGFVIGAAWSILNIRLLHRFVDALGSGVSQAAAGAAMSIRLLLLAALLYVIVKYLESGLAAALCGLFVAILAVILDSIYQLIHGSTAS